jgi:uncharacterized integral membrane protein
MFYLLLIIFMLMGGVLTVITIENLMTPVRLMLFTWQTPAFPLGLVILIFFVLGALLLYLVSVSSARSDKRELQVLRKRINQLEQQVEQGQTTTSPSYPMSRPADTSILQMPGMYKPPENRAG